MDDGLLITLVQQYEEIYNLKNKYYSNQQRRQNIWDEIGEKMGQSGNNCRERWIRLRDNHRKALKLGQTRSGQAATNIKPPKFHKELTFLVPYLFEDEERITNIPTVLSPANSEHSMIEVDEQSEGSFSEAGSPLNMTDSEQSNKTPVTTSNRNKKRARITESASNTFRRSPHSFFSVNG
ncbi:hypothetical protein ABEB36_014765 [Hypothenemus hampei]|uniref:MADF domain-containing protein n=1 Tax=Hypothenemus hampei TaxID=57062 RepID=A0ABD1E3M9_HYPHA